MNIKAEWRVELYKADADKCANEIMSLGEDVSPAQIVEYARNPNAELHRCYTWNDAEAAHKYRIYEARQVVCNLIVHKENGEKQEPTPIRLFHKAENGHYKPLALIVRNEDEYQSLLRQCKEALESIKRKYSSLSEYQEIWDLIN